MFLDRFGDVVVHLWVLVTYVWVWKDYGSFNAVFVKQSDEVIDVYRRISVGLPRPGFSEVNVRIADSHQRYPLNVYRCVFVENAILAFAMGKPKSWCYADR